MDGLKTFEITRSIVEENCLGLQNPFVLEIRLKIYIYCKQPHRLDIFAGHHVLIYLRDEYFFFQSIHESFLRTVPSYSDQANVWLGLLNHYGWKKVILLTSNDQDSRMIATRFTGLVAAENKIKVYSM